jgi:hypothetical protein
MGMSQSTQKKPIKWKNDNNFTEQNVIEESIQFEEARKLQAMSLEVAEQMQEKEVLKYTAYIAKAQGDLEEEKQPQSFYVEKPIALRSEALNFSKPPLQTSISSIQPQSRDSSLPFVVKNPVDPQSFTRLDVSGRQIKRVVADETNDKAIAEFLQEEEYSR